MHEHAEVVPPETAGVLLDVGDGFGALVVHAGEDLAGTEIQVTRAGEAGPWTHAVVHRRLAGGRPAYAAVFPSLREGDYVLPDAGGNGGGARGPVHAHVESGAVTEIRAPRLDRC